MVGGDIMCCENNVLKGIIVALALVFIIVLIIIIVNNSSNNGSANILVAVAEPGDNTTLGTTDIKFSKNEIVEGTALSHEEGTSIININETGIYQVSYQLFGVQDVTGTFNFNAVLLVNGAALNDTFNQSPVIRNSTSNRMTLTSTVILNLQAGDTLELQGVSIEDIRYDNARIDIEKIV